MTLLDTSISALRGLHDDLAARVADLTDDQLAGPSGASEWPVAQVLSHLGSGAEIALAGYRAAVEGTTPPGPSYNQEVWDRWNVLSARDQAEAYVVHDAALVSFLEGLSADQRASLYVDLGFLPAPLPLTSVVGMRLNEVAHHTWDVEVGFDPAATLDARAADALLDHFSAGLAFLLGFTGRADRLDRPAVVRIGGTDAALVLDEGISLTRGDLESSATFTGSTEAALRLMSGRLAPEHTPTGTDVTGTVTLDDLRRVFPGY